MAAFFIFGGVVFLSPWSAADSGESFQKTAGPAPVPEQNQSLLKKQAERRSCGSPCHAEPVFDRICCFFYQRRTNTGSAERTKPVKWSYGIKPPRHLFLLLISNMRAQSFTCYVLKRIFCDFWIGFGVSILLSLHLSQSAVCLNSYFIERQLFYGMNGGRILEDEWSEKQHVSCKSAICSRCRGMGKAWELLKREQAGYQSPPPPPQSPPPPSPPHESPPPSELP